MRTLLVTGLLIVAAGIAAYQYLRGGEPLPRPRQEAVSSKPTPPPPRRALVPPDDDPLPGPLPPLPEVEEARPGKPITVELTQPPVATYAGDLEDGAAEAYQRALAPLDRSDLVYDRHLAHAARELAYQYSFLGGTVPGDVLEFLLRSAGAVDRGTTQGYTATTSRAMDAVRERVAALLEAPAITAGQGSIHLGVGEAYVPGAKLPRFIAVILSRSRLEIEPAPRRVEVAQTWELRGTLPSGYGRPTALALFPDGTLRDVSERLEVGGDRFALRIPVGQRTGLLEVSVGATGPLGPRPLVQLPVQVGRPLPRTLRTVIPPTDDGLSAAAAEARAFRLLNGTRLRHRRRALTRDPDLDRIARAHSADMREGRFFGHRSPNTGSLGDRIGRAGYRAVTFAENLSFASSIHEGHAGLVHSLGHRRNLLHPRMERVGIGVVAARRKGRRHWLLTQVFARPVARLDRAAVRARVMELLNSRRDAANASRLVLDARLDRLASVAAHRAEEQGRGALRAATRAARGRTGSWAWLLRTTEVDRIALPDEVDGATYRRVGIGLAQSRTDSRGAVSLVLLLAGEG